MGDSARESISDASGNPPGAGKPDRAQTIIDDLEHRKQLGFKLISGSGTTPESTAMPQSLSAVVSPLP
jgi:hypothetical protein